MTININKQQNIKLLLYPDNQPHVQIPHGIGYNYLMQPIPVDVVCSITDSLKMIQLLETANAIENEFAEKGTLYIPYLMGARFDRKMEDGDSVDLKVIAKLINSMGFKRVQLFYIHSETALQLIDNSVNKSNSMLVDQYTIPDSILICPDAGAVKKVSKYMEWNKNLVDVVYVNKTRNLSNGNLTIKVLEHEKCDNRSCVIIDDLCDGGGTFVGIATQVRASHMSLIVTHGIFSQGFNTLDKWFHEIIVSNSYRDSYNSNIVKLINCI